MGARIRAERDRLGLSQQKAADAAGVRREMWARYEAGSEPGANVLAAIATAGADILYIVIGQRGGTLSAEEQTLLTYYRDAELAVRKAAMGALLGAATQAPATMTNKGSGTIQVGHVGGDVSVGAERPQKKTRQKS